MAVGVPADPRCTFASFVVGPANRLAYGAARAAAEAPGTTYNPLFLYAGPGLGKTHLLMAIANEIRETQPEHAVVYTTLEGWWRDLQADPAAARTYEAATVCLVDDLQFLSTRPEAHAAFFDLLDRHLAAGHQVVLACDRPPMEMDHVDGRLVSRFSGGLVVDIGRPGFETRVEILRRKLDERGAALSPHVVEEIARLVIDNVRQLQGALHKVLAVQRVEAREVTAAEVRRLIADLAASGALAWMAEEGPTDRDEFSAFLDEVARAVEEAVHAPGWRRAIEAAVARFEAEGYRTARLEALLDSETPVDPDVAIAQFARDVEALKAAAREMERLDPARARHPAFFDPDRVAEAEAMVREAKAAATVVDPFFLDREKVVLDWPVLDDLLFEEFV
jgi:chromosomal replication initiator protein